MPPATPFITTDVAAAARALAAGRPAAFATETVYGLGADAANADAVAALYRLKNRPPAHPVIVHLADAAAMSDWARDVPPAARLLAARFMPGALTLLLPRRPSIRHLAGGDLIALRVPAHPLARELLRRFGGGVAAPSANRFGGLSPTSAAHVAAEFAGEPLLILDGGDCSIGIESTIAGFHDGAAFIARPGDVSAEMMRAAGVEVIPAPHAVPAPGALPRHYAPQTPLLLAEEADIPARLAALPPEARAGVLSFAPVESAAVWRQAAAAPAQYAHELYRHLRALDESGLTLIIAARPPAGAAWEAVHDRLRKAAVT